MSNAVFEAWKQSVTKSIFLVTFSREEAEQSHWERIYLQEVAEELVDENEGQAPIVSPQVADRILVSRLSLDPVGDAMTYDAEKQQVLASLPSGETSWDYLVGSWKRCRREEQRLRKVVPGQAVLDELRTLIISYLGLILQTPDMFPLNKKGSEELSPLVLVPSLLNLAVTPVSAFTTSSAPTPRTSSRWATFDNEEVPILLSDLARRFADDDEGLDEILGPAFKKVVHILRDGESSASSSSDPSGSTLGSSGADNQAQEMLAQLLGRSFTQASSRSRSLWPTDGYHIGGLEWSSYVMVIVQACENKQIGNMITSLSDFNPDTPAQRFELDSLLGPILRLSTFADTFPALLTQYFADPDSRSRTELESSQNTMRTTLERVHTLNFRLFNSLVRGGPASREAVLAYWGHACSLNEKRAAMRTDPRVVSSDGFMVNLFELAMRFAEPFMTADYSKIDRIDLQYMRTQKRFDASGLTRLSATEQEAAKWSEEAVASAPHNFITEVFYLALRLTTLGPVKAISTLEERAKMTRRYQSDLRELESGRASWGAQAPQFEAQCKQLKAAIVKMKGEAAAAETQLLDKDFVDRLVNFTSFVMTWLVRLADPAGAHPKTQVSLPLPKEAPEHFKMLPESVFEDTCDILLFLSRSRPTFMGEAAKTDLITFSTVFLSGGWYIKNPFLKAKLAEILYYNVIPYGPFKNGILGEAINFHKLALKHLVPALMSFWIEAESTGSHTQFYDKFNIRYHLAQIFKAIWTNQEHMANLHEQARSRSTEFVVFINRLMNDVTFLVNQAIERLVELHDKQQQLADETFWEGKDEKERQEAEQHASTLEKWIRTDLQMGQEFLRVLIDFSGETKDAFMVPEIVDRLAAMLDYNLDMLAGPRCQELKVKDPKKTGFAPRDLLRQILSVYLNFATRTEFAQAIARDGRSYSREIFSKAAGIATKYMLKSPIEIVVLKGLVEQVEKIRQQDADAELELGDVPDDFEDPLMATLMTDPVILPSSKVVVDRSTIKSHLLSDSTDPFNRVPLKLEDVLPATELKARIDAWIAERKAARVQKGAPEVVSAPEADSNQEQAGVLSQREADERDVPMRES